MPETEPFGQGVRLAAIALLVVALFGTFVWYGSSGYEPTANDYPSDETVVSSPTAYVDERVTVGGEVLQVDPVVVAVESGDGYTEMTLHGVSETLIRGDDPEPGMEIRAHGTLTTDETLEVERAFTRESWTTTYMYAISVVGAVWVVGRSIRGWRFDRDRLAFVPRRQPLPVDPRSWGGDSSERKNATMSEDRHSQTGGGERSG